MALHDIPWRLARIGASWRPSSVEQRPELGQRTAFAYDDHNRLVARTDPLGFTETLAYDAVGNLAARTDRKGQTLAYTYDVLNRLTVEGQERLAGRPTLA